MGQTVRGHLSISLPLLSSPTLPLFICISPHLCTISRDHTQSQRLSARSSARTSTASDEPRTQ
jgi:hypothetical protein